MKIESCRRERELLDALMRGYVDPDLAAHASECAACCELRLVAGALIEERIDAVAAAPVPSAEAMWLRMQMRAHQDAQARARRSLVIGQAATLLVAIGLVLSLFGGDLVAAAYRVVTSIRISTPLLLVIATWLVTAPLAGWVAIRR
jgi:hypothetical protein